MGFALCALVIMFLYQTFKMGVRTRPFRLRPELSLGRINCGAQAFAVFFEFLARRKIVSASRYRRGRRGRQHVDPDYVS